MTFADEFKNARKAKGMTQEEAARAIRRTVQTISRYERGVYLPEWGDLAFIAEVFDADLGPLIDAWQADKQADSTPSAKLKDQPKTGNRINPDQIAGHGVLNDEDRPAIAKLLEQILEQQAKIVERLDALDPEH